MDDRHDNLFTLSERAYCQEVILLENIVEVFKTTQRAVESLDQFLQAYLRAAGFDQQFLSGCGISKLEEEAAKK